MTNTTETPWNPYRLSGNLPTGASLREWEEEAGRVYQPVFNRVGGRALARETVKDVRHAARILALIATLAHADARNKELQERLDGVREQRDAAQHERNDLLTQVRLLKDTAEANNRLLRQVEHERDAVVASLQNIVTGVRAVVGPVAEEFGLDD